MSSPASTRLDNVTNAVFVAYSLPLMHERTVMKPILVALFLLPVSVAPVTAQETTVKELVAQLKHKDAAKRIEAAPN